MEWLERNLEAYRLVTEVLSELRATMRRDLERIHGESWFRVALPDGLLDRLIESKEREKAIDWYESEYQQVIDYALFSDLLEIIELNAEHFQYIVRLAPSMALLHARFLELEVIRSKLGRTRPVSDGEVAFLRTFHKRFQAALAGVDGAAAVPSTASPTPPTKSSPAAAEVAPPAPAAPTAEPSATNGGGASPRSDRVAGDPPQDTTADPVPADDAGESEGTPPPSAGPRAANQPPRRAATRPPQRPARGAPAATAAVAAEDEQDEPDTDGRESAAGERPSLLQSLEQNDSRNVLRELYREVTGIADGIWTSGTAPSTPIWDTVSTTDWYEGNFSRLGLRPLSDFYEVVSQVTTRIEDGVGRNELQKFLKDINFAQVLLALRDMFQKAGI